MEINLGDLGISPEMLARIQAGGGIMGKPKPKGKKKAVAKKAKPGVKLRRGKPVASKSPSTGRKGVNPLAGINIEELMSEIGGEGGGVGNYYRGANPVPTPPKPSASGAAPGVMRQLKDLFGGADPIKTSQFPTGEPANMLEFADVPAGAFKLGGGGGSGGILPKASSGTTDTPYSTDLRPGDEGFDYVADTAERRSRGMAPRDFTVGAEGNLDDLRREYESLVNAQIGDDSGILPKDELGRPDKDALARRSSRLGELAVGIYNQDSSFESPYMNSFDEIGRVRGQPAPTESWGGETARKGREIDAAKYAEARARNDGSFNQAPAAPAPAAPPPPPQPLSATPRNILGPSYDPKNREAYAAKVQAQRDAMKPGGNIKSQYPTAMNPMSAMPQTQFGGYGAQMPMQALNPYAGMARRNPAKTDFFPDYIQRPPATGMAPKIQPKITD